MLYEKPTIVSLTLAEFDNAKMTAMLQILPEEPPDGEGGGCKCQCQCQCQCQKQ